MHISRFPLKLRIPAIEPEPYSPHNTTTTNGGRALLRLIASATSSETGLSLIHVKIRPAVIHAPARVFILIGKLLDSCLSAIFTFKPSVSERLSCSNLALLAF